MTGRLGPVLDLCQMKNRQAVFLLFQVLDRGLFCRLSL